MPCTPVALPSCAPLSIQRCVNLCEPLLCVCQLVWHRFCALESAGSVPAIILAIVGIILAIVGISPDTLCATPGVLRGCACVLWQRRCTDQHMFSAQDAAQHTALCWKMANASAHLLLWISLRLQQPPIGVAMRCAC